MLNTYYNPVRTYQGVGSLSVLPQLVNGLNPKKILLLIWDESVLENRYIKETAAAFADILTVKTFAWSNPEMFQLYEIYNETKNENYELVIAVGGGSVLDVGKSLCCLYAQPVESLETMRTMIAEKTYSKPQCKWIGIPTTAGTGSEVTCWATVWDSEHNKKYSVDTQDNYAYAAVIDPVLASSMPLSTLCWHRPCRLSWLFLPRWTQYATRRKVTGLRQAIPYRVRRRFRQLKLLWIISTGFCAAKKKRMTPWRRAVCWPGLHSAIRALRLAIPFLTR